jgi:nicotinamide mononucleotide transporter
MNLSHITEQIIAQFKTTSWIEWLAFVFGVAQVILAQMNKTINFYAGMISVVLYCYVFYLFGLYAESMLNVYYLLISLLGIFYWQTKESPVISECNTLDWLKAVGIFILSFVLLFFILKKYTNSSVPTADALVSAFAWSGSWLLIKRKLENWLVLNISNVLAVPLLFYKQLGLTALLTIIYIVVAILGYVSWRKEIQHAA